MTKDEFIKKWNPNAVVCPSFMESDLTALIESEIKQAGRVPFIPPFELHFKECHSGSNYKGMVSYAINDDRGTLAFSGIDSLSNIKYLCALLNRE